MRVLRPFVLFNGDYSAKAVAESLLPFVKKSPSTNEYYFGNAKNEFERFLVINNFNILAAEPNGAISGDNLKDLEKQEKEKFVEKIQTAQLTLFPEVWNATSRYQVVAYDGIEYVLKTPTGQIGDDDELPFLIETSVVAYRKADSANASEKDNWTKLATPISAALVYPLIPFTDINLENFKSIGEANLEESDFKRAEQSNSFRDLFFKPASVDEAILDSLFAPSAGSLTTGVVQATYPDLQQMPPTTPAVNTQPVTQALEVAKAQIQSLSTTISEQEQKITKLGEEKKEMQEKLDEVKKQLAESAKKMDEQLEMIKKSSTNEVLQNELSNKVAVIEKQKKEYQELKKKYDELDKQVKQETEKNKKLQKDLESVQNNLKKAEADIRRKPTEEDVKKIEEQRAECDSNLQNCKLQYKTLEENHEKLKKELETTNEKNKELKTALVNLQQQLDQNQVELQQRPTQQQVEEAQKAREQSGLDAKKYELELERSKQTVKALQNAIQRLSSLPDVSNDQATSSSGTTSTPLQPLAALPLETEPNNLENAFDSGFAGGAPNPADIQNHLSDITDAEKEINKMIEENQVWIKIIKQTPAYKNGDTDRAKEVLSLEEKIADLKNLSKEFQELGKNLESVRSSLVDSNVVIAPPKVKPGNPWLKPDWQPFDPNPFPILNNNALFNQPSPGVNSFIFFGVELEGRMIESLHFALSQQYYKLSRNVERNRTNLTRGYVVFFQYDDKGTVTLAPVGGPKRVLTPEQWTRIQSSLPASKGKFRKAEEANSVLGEKVVAMRDANSGVRPMWYASFTHY